MAQYSVRRCRALLAVALLCFSIAAATGTSFTNGYSYPGKRRHRRSEDKGDILKQSQKDGLAISREIFKNITKQLRENIASKDFSVLRASNQEKKAEHLAQNVVEPQGINRPHHHEHHWGPYFEGEVSPGKTAQAVAHQGSEVLLPCRVGMLKDKTVMWLRKRVHDVQLLTVGPAPYAGDSRVSVRFQYPNNWKLSINPVKKEDSGIYICQISTHPPRLIQTNLTVLEPILSIVDEQGHEVKDRFYKAGSSIELSCKVSKVYIDNFEIQVNYSTKRKAKLLLPTVRTTTASQKTTTEKITANSFVTNVTLQYEKPGYNITIESDLINEIDSQETTIPPTTEKPIIILKNIYELSWRKNSKEINNKLITMKNSSSIFFVMSATQNDSGIYTCLVANHSAVSVNVNVLIGENQAAVHHDTWNKAFESYPFPFNWYLLVLFSIMYVL